MEICNEIEENFQKILKKNRKKFLKKNCKKFKKIVGKV